MARRRVRLAIIVWAMPGLSEMAGSMTQRWTGLGRGTSMPGLFMQCERTVIRKLRCGASAQKRAIADRGELLYRACAQLRSSGGARQALRRRRRLELLNPLSYLWS